MDARRSWNINSWFMAIGGDSGPPGGGNITTVKIMEEQVGHQEQL